MGKLIILLCIQIAFWNKGDCTNLSVITSLSSGVIGFLKFVPFLSMKGVIASKMILNVMHPRILEELFRVIFQLLEQMVEFPWRFSNLVNGMDGHSPVPMIPQSSVKVEMWVFSKP